jgi:hypothetical protein
LAAIQSPEDSFCLAIGDKKGVFPSDDPQYQLLYSELAQATNQVVTATTGIQFSQRREGVVKKRKKRCTRLLTKHSRTQYSIDAGGVAFISIVNCDICKAKHLNSRGTTTRIPHRAHHKACSINLRTRRASEMTAFVTYWNERAESFGLPPIFDDTRPVSENNGEVSLSAHFEEQLMINGSFSEVYFSVRNQTVGTVGQDKETSMCLCPTCITYMSKNWIIRTRGK